MASKRLNLTNLGDEHQEVVTQPTAKKLKGALETPDHRMVMSSCSNILSPIRELSLNIRGEDMNLNGDGGGKPISIQRPFQRSFNSISCSYDLENSLDDDENMVMLQLEEYEEREELQRRSMRRYRSSKEHKHQSQGLSMNDAEIMTALGDEPQLIGDLSKPCALPCLLTGTRHHDLKTISGDTLARLIKGEFVKELGTGGGYQIIDCRYPYEFIGGHIQGARNLYTRGQIHEAFPSLTHKEEAGRRIYVFHCEFSSQRGPRLLRFLRNRDRQEHVGSYPTLDYPELYLLHKGYKEFHGSHGYLCEPRDYVPMLSPAYKEELRRFRSRTRSKRQSGEGEDEGEGKGGDIDTGSQTQTQTRSRTLRRPLSLTFCI